MKKQLLLSFVGLLGIQEVHAAEASAVSSMASVGAERNGVERLSQMIEEHQGVFDQARGQDITVFIGNTGVGKSSMINVLSGAPLEIDDDGRIVLKNGASKVFPAIGGGFGSVTKAPFMVRTNTAGYVFDLPGFLDTEGAVDDLLNAAFIRGIITSARSVKALILTSQAEISSARGNLLKSIVKATQMFPESFRRASCLFVINQVSKRRIDKGSAKTLLKSFIDHLETEAQKTPSAQADLAFFQHLVEGGKTSFVAKADDYSEEEQFYSEVREELEKRIQGLVGSPVGDKDVNMGITLKAETRYFVEEFFEVLMQRVLEQMKASQAEEEKQNRSGEEERKEGENRTSRADYKHYFPTLVARLKETVREEGKPVSALFAEQFEESWEEFEKAIRSRKEAALLFPLCEGVFTDAIEGFRPYFRKEHEALVAALKITEQKEAEAKALEAQEKAERAYKQAIEEAAEASRRAELKDREAQEAKEEAERAKEDQQKTQDEKDRFEAMAQASQRRAEEARARAAEAEQKAQEDKERAERAQAEYKEAAEKAKREFESKISDVEAEIKRREERYEREKEELSRTLSADKEKLAQQMAKLNKKHEKALEAARKREAQLESVQKQVEGQLKEQQEVYQKQLEEQRVYREQLEKELASNVARREEWERKMESVEEELRRERDAAQEREQLFRREIEEAKDAQEAMYREQLQKQADEVERLKQELTENALTKEEFAKQLAEMEKRHQDEKAREAEERRRAAEAQRVAKLEEELAAERKSAKEREEKLLRNQQQLADKLAELETRKSPAQKKNLPRYGASNPVELDAFGNCIGIYV